MIDTETAKTLTKQHPPDEDHTVRCQCGEPLLRDSPRFRAGGPTAVLCWVWHTVNHKCPKCQEVHE